MDTPYRAGEDVHVLPTHLDVPGVGTLHVNAFVLLAEEPVLVDTGLAVDETEFIEALRSIVDPADLRWVWLTHDDTDHTGSLEAVMELAPQASLVTHALGALRMSTWWPIPLDRVHAIRVGDRVDVGDRTLLATMPLTFDNPTTTALVDERTGTFFSVDAFGAILPEPAQDLDEVPDDALAGGMLAWATFDSPWAHMVERSLFARTIEEFRRLDPDRILSSHLPASWGRADQFLKIIEGVPDADPFVPPDADAFREIVRQLPPPGPEVGKVVEHSELGLDTRA